VYLRRLQTIPAICCLFNSVRNVRIVKYSICFRKRIILKNCEHSSSSGTTAAVFRCGFPEVVIALPPPTLFRRVFPQHAEAAVSVRRQVPVVARLNRIFPGASRLLTCCVNWERVEIASCNKTGLQSGQQRCSLFEKRTRA